MGALAVVDAAEDLVGEVDADLSLPVVYISSGLVHCAKWRGTDICILESRAVWCAINGIQASGERILARHSDSSIGDVELPARCCCAYLQGGW